MVSHQRFRRGATSALALSALATGLLIGTAPTAAAANGTIGQRETVCADDLYVRKTPNDGAYDGVLHRGESFTVDSRDGNYVHGFAYGHVNRNGWVQDGWFC